jgi:hypothetical protein
MSRDEIIASLFSLGAIAYVHAIQDVEAGRMRRVLLPPLHGSPAFAREVVALLRSLGAEVEFAPRPSGAERPRHVREARRAPADA